MASADVIVAAAICRAANSRWADPADHCLLPPGTCDGCQKAARDAVTKIAGPGAPSPVPKLPMTCWCGRDSKDPTHCTLCGKNASPRSIWIGLGAAWIAALLVLAGLVAAWASSL